MDLTTDVDMTAGFYIYIIYDLYLDQCWTILKPKYESWAFGAIFGAANNDIIANPTGIQYTWNNEAGGTHHELTDPATVESGDDKSNRETAIKGLADKLNDASSGVGGKLGEAWKPNELWTQELFKDPVIILTVVLGIIGLLLIIGVIVVSLTTKNEIYIIIGISISVLTVISLLAGLLPSNYEDKKNLKEISLEYYTNSPNGMTLYPNKNTSTIKQVGGSVKLENQTTIDARYVTSGNHFKTADEPQVRLKNNADISNQTLGLAMANIIALLDIIFLFIVNITKTD